MICIIVSYNVISVWVCTPPSPRDPAASDSYLEIVIRTSLHVEVENVCMSQDSE